MYICIIYALYFQIIRFGWNRIAIVRLFGVAKSNVKNVALLNNNISAVVRKREEETRDAGRTVTGTIYSGTSRQTISWIGRKDQ